MKRRTFVATASAAMASIAGCSSLGNGDGEDSSGGDQVDASDNSAGATDVAQTLRFPVGEDLAGQTVSSLSATYPRDRFTVDSAQHEDIAVGVDGSGDGTLDTEFDADSISGVNNNEYSFTIAMDTDYELAAGDVVVLDYPSIDNPEEAGDYDVTVQLNEGPETTATVRIE